MKLHINLHDVCSGKLDVGGLVCRCEQLRPNYRAHNLLQYIRITDKKENSQKANASIVMFGNQGGDELT